MYCKGKGVTSALQVFSQFLTLVDINTHAASTVYMYSTVQQQKHTQHLHFAFIASAPPACKSTNQYSTTHTVASYTAPTPAPTATAHIKTHNICIQHFEQQHTHSNNSLIGSSRCSFRLVHTMQKNGLRHKKQFIFL